LLRTSHNRGYVVNFCSRPDQLSGGSRRRRQIRRPTKPASKKEDDRPQCYIISTAGKAEQMVDKNGFKLCGADVQLAAKASPLSPGRCVGG
jgi:hypothetical protein